MKRLISYFTVLLSLFISVGRIFHALWFKTSIPFEPIIFLPIFLSIIGIYFAKYNKNKIAMRIVNSFLIILPIITFYTVLEIID